MNRKEIILISATLLTLVISRILPHPPNFTAAMAGIIFCGMTVRRTISLWSLLLGYFLSDLLINNLYYGITSVSWDQVYWVYFPLSVIFFLSRMFSAQGFGPFHVLGSSLLGSFFFFIFSNFGVWAGSALYSKDLTGIMTCFTAALPFWANEMAGSLFYSLLLFGIYWQFEKRDVLLYARS